MRMGLRIAALIVGCGIALAGTEAGGAPLPQSARSKKDKDLSLIGKRKIEKGANNYSLQEETKLGAKLAQDAERNSVMMKDAAVAEYLERISKKLAQNSDARMPVTVRVIQSEKVNSFTLAGGHLYVTSGLILQTEGEGELAGVLARGIAHTAMRSGTYLLTKSVEEQLSAIQTALSGRDAQGVPIQSGSVNLGAARNLAGWQRDTEFDADYFGLQYLYKAGYDPEAFVRFLERTESIASWAKTPRPVFDPFPPVPERARALRKEMAEILPRRDGAMVTSPEFEAFKERVRAVTTTR